MARYARRGLRPSSLVLAFVQKIPGIASSRRRKHCPDFLIAHHRRDFAVHVAQRNLVMLLVVRINAVRGHDDFPVALIGIDGGHADTGMGVEASQDQSIGFEAGEQLVKSRAVEGAISLLDDDRVGWSDRQLRRNLAPRRPWIVTRIPLVLISGNASRRSGWNSWRTQMTGRWQSRTMPTSALVERTSLCFAAGAHA
jgi:hypothetical protein